MAAATGLGHPAAARRGGRRFGALALALLAGTAVMGCSSSDENFRVPGLEEYNQDSRRARVRGRLTGEDGILLFGQDRSRQRAEAEQGSGGLGVNAFLWRATLDTLSFMPLASADPFGGVVITDWYTPPGVQGERFRATAYILGRQLRSDGIRVVLFRQEQRGGAWVDVPVSPGTTAELEDQVLNRARELRADSSTTAAR